MCMDVAVAIQSTAASVGVVNIGSRSSSSSPATNGPHKHSSLLHGICRWRRGSRMIAGIQIVRVVGIITIAVLLLLIVVGIHGLELGTGLGTAPLCHGEAVRSCMVCMMAMVHMWLLLLLLLLLHGHLTLMMVLLLLMVWMLLLVMIIVIHRIHTVAAAHVMIVVIHHVVVTTRHHHGSRRMIATTSTISTIAIVIIVQCGR
mmetsp:Transcript_3898/g.5958  ORF Transcript_3898/g.5958 Transcript_3898/m.5958 type:complete len:202 (-) Transcript_3898:412-1017(-)